MSACETCWRDASMCALLLGGSVADHYRALLDERRDNPCPQSVGEAESMDARFTKADEGEACEAFGSATEKDPIR
jgi:hypothetical protein